MKWSELVVVAFVALVASVLMKWAGGFEVGILYFLIIIAYSQLRGWR